MIRSPLALKIPTDPSRSPRDPIREAAILGLKGVVLDAAGELAPDRLSDTGRRDLRNLLRSMELSLVAISLPTRRPFDTIEQIEDRIGRADRAFDLAYQLGTSLVLLRVGAVPAEAESFRRGPFETALRELGRRAEHRGVRLGIETGSESGADLAAFLSSIDVPSLGASIDPGALLSQGINPAQATRDLSELVVHAYARDASGLGPSGTNPFGGGFAPGVLDWEEFLGSLEEIGYRGFLTIWPGPGRAVATQVESMQSIFRRF
jgi:sugar phosphate isomerase/epimerase